MNSAHLRYAPPLTRAAPVPRHLILLPIPAAKPAQLSVSGIHPVAVAVPLAAVAWFLIVAWSAFGHGEAVLVLAVVTFFSLMYFGLLVGGSAAARDVTLEHKHQRSFREFLDGDVEIATGRISGRQALLQIAAMPICLAIGFTLIAVIAVISQAT